MRAAVFSLFALHTGTVFAEQQCDAPNARQADDRIDDAAEHSALTAEQPCHQVKLEDAHKAQLSEPMIERINAIVSMRNTSVRIVGCT